MLPDGLISYGPDANCTLALCPITSTVLQYRPALSANVAFLVLFAIAMILHLLYSLRWREYFFAAMVSLGCITEIIGYGGRIMLYQDPFSFTGFIMQICCITFAPVFFCAAIYVLLSRIVQHLDPTLSRFGPKVWYALFIPCDIISLVLQATGGAMSSSSSGSSKTGVDIALAGLGFQVATLFIFCVACIDYAVRYSKSATRKPLTGRFKVFVTCLTFSILAIFIRCAYRIRELQNGYSGPLIADQKLFIALEGAMIVVAVYSLLGANPGPSMGARMATKGVEVEKGVESSSDDEMVRT